MQGVCHMLATSLQGLPPAQLQSSKSHHLGRQWLESAERNLSDYTIKVYVFHWYKD